MTIVSFIAMKTLRLKSKYAWTAFPTSLLIGVLVFYLIPQPQSPAGLSTQPLPARSGSSGIYTAPGAVTRGTTLDNSQITGCHTGIENYGVQEDVFMKNSIIGCAPDTRPAPAPTGTAPTNSVPPNPGASGIYNAPGVTTSVMGIMNSTVEGCANGFQFNTNRTNVVMNGVHIICAHSPARVGQGSGPTGQIDPIGSPRN